MAFVIKYVGRFEPAWVVKKEHFKTFFKKLCQREKSRGPVAAGWCVFAGMNRSSSFGFTKER